jgi:hypothetical protein
VEATTLEHTAAEISALDVDGLLHELLSLEDEQRVRDARRSIVLAELEARKAHRADSHATIFGMLRSKLHWSEVECRQRMRLARLIAAHPSVGATLFEAQMSTANAATIANLWSNRRLRERFDSVLGELLGEACTSEHDDFQRHPLRWELLNDPAARTERAELDAQRDARISITGGKGRLSAEWGDLDAATNAAIFDRFVDAEFDADWAVVKARHGDEASMASMPRTNAQRRADALTAIFKRAATSPAGGREPKPVVAVHLDSHTFNEILTSARIFPERQVDPFDDPTPLISRMRCETGDGVLINPDRVLQVLLEGYVRFVASTDEGEVIHWGRKRRLFEGAAREAVMSLSPRCITNGCRVKTSRSEADHLDPWGDGHPTDPGNGGPQCGSHNDAKRRRRWRVTRDHRGHWHRHRPDGTEII